MARANRTDTGRLAALIVLAVAILYLPWLGHTDLIHEETRRAVIARTMMDSGDYLIPQLAERIYLAKPPVFNWMIAAASAPGGAVTEFTARLPSVISLALLAVLMACTAGRRLEPPGRWLLGLSVIVTGEFMHKAVLAEIDVAFALLVSASLWGWFELDERGRRGLALWLPPALLVVLAFLTKREPALVFYYLAIGGYLLTQRRFGELFRPAHLVAAAATLGAVGAWIALLAAEAGTGRLVEDVTEEVLTRGLSPSASDYLVHFVSYPLEILGAALPFSPLLLPLAWPSVRAALRERHGRMFVFAGVAVVANLLPYWLRADANVRYFLPMFPMLLVLAALVFDAFASGAHPLARGARRVFAGVGWVMLALAAVLATAGLVLSLPGLFPEVAGPIVPAPIMAALCLAALAGAGWLAVRRGRHAAVLVFAATVGFGVLFRLLQLGFVVPHEAREIARTEDVPAILETLRRHLPGDTEHVQGLGSLPHAIWFYDRAGTVVPEARYERTGELASPWVLVRARDAQRLQELARPVTRVARIDYADGDFILARVGSPARR